MSAEFLAVNLTALYENCFCCCIMFDWVIVWYGCQKLILRLTFAIHDVNGFEFECELRVQIHVLLCLS